MRQPFIVLALLLPIAAAAPSSATAQVPVAPPVVRIPALQDSAVELTLRKAREALDNAQRLLEDTTVFAAVNRVAERAAALSAQLDQQAALDRVLQQSDANLRAVLRQLERTQRRLDELMRQQPN